MVKHNRLIDCFRLDFRPCSSVKIGKGFLCDGGGMVYTSSGRVVELGVHMALKKPQGSEEHALAGSNPVPPTTRGLQIFN